MGLSLNPDKAVVIEFLDDTDICINTARFVEHQFTDKNGNIAGDPFVGLCLEYTMDATGSNGKEYMRVGSTELFGASEDGLELIGLSDPENQTINAKCKMMIFLKSLKDAGLPQELLDKLDAGEIQVLDGLGIHVMRNANHYQDLATIQEDGSEKKVTALEATKINYLPGEGKSKAKGKAAPKAAGKPGGKPGSKPAAKPAAKPAKEEEPEAAEAPASDDIDSIAEEAMMAVLADNDGQVEAKQIPTQVFRHLGANTPNRNKVLKRCYDEGFLSDDARPWSFEGGVVSLG